MRSSFIVLVGITTVLLLAMGESVRGTPLPLAYGKGVFAEPSENVLAFWGLEDLATYGMSLKSTAHAFRNPLSLPSPADVRGVANGFTGGHILFRQSDNNAVTGEAISVVGLGGSLMFPLTVVGGSSFTLHFWVKFTSDPAAAFPVPADEPAFLTFVGSSLALSTRELRGNGSPIPISGAGFVSGGWNFVAVSVQLTSPSSSAWAVHINGVSAAAASVAGSWSASAVFLRDSSSTRTTFDNVALAASVISGDRLADLAALGNEGACADKPCFSGTVCSALSSSRFQCGSCPPGYHGDGVRCAQTKLQYPVDYRSCVPRAIDLLNPAFCANTCEHRWTCMACTDNYEKVGRLAQLARGICDVQFAYERSATRTPSKTATSSHTPSSSTSASVTSSITASVTLTPTSSISWSPTSSISQSPTRPPSVSSSRTRAPTPTKTPGLPCAQVIMRNDNNGATLTLAYADCYYDICFTGFNDASTSFTVNQYPGGPASVTVTLYEHYSPGHGPAGQVSSYSGYGYHFINPNFGVSSVTVSCA